MKIHLLGILLPLLLLQGCFMHPADSNNTIIIQGSDSFIPLLRVWSAAYEQSHRGIKIIIRGGGTASGFSALEEGNCHLCAASRTITYREAERMAKRYNSLGIAFIVARDAIAIIKDRDNPVFSLSVEELSDIFSGKKSDIILNNGIKYHLTPFIRNRNSGTYNYFMEHVLNGGNYAPAAREFADTKTMVDSIIGNKTAVGYGSLAYARGAGIIRINGFYPDSTEINRYPLTRYLYFYTISMPEGNVKNFIDWVYTREAQNLISSTGCFPLY